MAAGANLLVPNEASLHHRRQSQPAVLLSAGTDAAARLRSARRPSDGGQLPSTSLDDVAEVPMPVATAEAPERPVLARAVALFPNSTEGELSFQQGDVIEILQLEQDGDGFFVGRTLDGRVGSLPSVMVDWSDDAAGSEDGGDASYDIQPPAPSATEDDV